MEWLMPDIDYSKIKLSGVFFVDEIYSQNHAHMLHKHKELLELLYIAEGSGRYLVGSREYAVSKGDFLIINANTIHGEAPFQKYTIRTYCCTLAGVSFKGFALGEMMKRE